MSLSWQYASGGHRTTKRISRSAFTFTLACALSWTSFESSSFAEEGDVPPPPLTSQSDIVKFLEDGTIYGQERYHFEDVRKSGFRADAQANSLRSVLGYKTGIYQDFQVDLSLLNVAQFGDHDYDDGSDGKASKYPLINDPANTALLHASLIFTGLPQTTIVGGRQEIGLDNQRWIGSSHFRQTIQTFDGVTIKNESVPNLEMYYGYLFDQNRAGGPFTTNGQYDLSANLFHATYTGIENIRLAAYSYLSDNTNIHFYSNATSGFRIEAADPFESGWKITGNAEYARQTNYGDNPDVYGLGYYLVAPGFGFKSFNMKFGYEGMEGNGRDAVQTPMTSPHPINAWADQFQITPPNGLHDTYLNAKYVFQLPIEGLDTTRLNAFFHVFNAERTSMHYGNEYDFGVTQKIDKNFAVSSLIEDYSADHLLADVRKIVVNIQVDY